MNAHHRIYSHTSCCAVLSSVRRFSSSFDATLLLPFIAPLAESNVDQAVLLLARLRLAGVPVPRHVYVTALLSLVRTGQLRLDTPKAGAILKMMTADHGAMSTSQVRCSCERIFNSSYYHLIA